jgi:hypothetical protein
LDTRFIIRTESISVSGFDGSLKEQNFDFTPKQGYYSYTLKITPMQYDKDHYLHYASNMINNTGTVVMIHNFKSEVTKLIGVFLFVRK